MFLLNFRSHPFSIILLSHYESIPLVPSAEATHQGVSKNSDIVRNILNFGFRIIQLGYEKISDLMSLPYHICSLSTKGDKDMKIDDKTNFDILKC